MADQLPDLRNQRKASTPDAMPANLKQGCDPKLSVGENHGVVEEILINNL